jgi:ribonuclease VapC
VTEIVVDTSALLAILFGEPDANRYADVLTSNAGSLHLSAVNAVEAGIVIEARSGSEGAAKLRDLQARLRLEVEPVDRGQVELAVRAWRRFGKGRHPARLNLGDCFAYALTAAVRGRLLYKGDGFSQTDVAALLE